MMKMEPSLTMVGSGTDGSSLSLMFPMMPVGYTDTTNLLSSNAVAIMQEKAPTATNSVVYCGMCSIEDGPTHPTEAELLNATTKKTATLPAKVQRQTHSFTRINLAGRKWLFTRGSPCKSLLRPLRGGWNPYLCRTFILSCRMLSYASSMASLLRSCLLYVCIQPACSVISSEHRCRCSLHIWRDDNIMHQI